MYPDIPRTSPAALKRKQQIENCLLENMLHTPYHLVSVADICRQVGISRRAFYTYYPDKDACLHSLIDQVIRQSMKSTEDFLEKTVDPVEGCTEHLEFWKSQKTFLDAIVRNDLIHVFLGRNINYFLEEEHSLLRLLDTPNVEPDMDILYSYTGIRISLLIRWYSRNFDTPTEEMARKYVRMIQSPMIHL